MAKLKTYIVAPNYTTRSPPPDYYAVDDGGEGSNNAGIGAKAPPAGALCLGDIIRDPLQPQLIPLNRLSRLPIPAADLLPPDVKTDFTATRRTLLSGRLGLHAILLAALGLPGAATDASLALSRTTEDVISAARLETLEFLPSDAFVRDAMTLQPDVRAYLDGSASGRRPPPPLYMVTGLKVVRGASVRSEAGSAAEGGLGVGLPLGSATARVLDFSRTRAEGMSFEGSTDFVLAFRVNKVLYRKGVFEHRLSQKGASMMDEQRPDQVENSEVVVGGVGEDYEVDEELYDEEDVLVEKDDEDMEWMVPNLG